MAGLVAFDFADGLGREVRAVGFDEDAVVWHFFGDRSQVVGLLERDHAGKADVEAHLDALFAHGGAAGEGVHDAAQWAALAGFAEHDEDVFVAIADVDDERQATLLREPDVAVEIILLDVEGREVPVAVEAGFADGDNFRLV